MVIAQNDNKPAIVGNSGARTKTCSMCEQEKPLDEFHKQPTGKYGRHSYCAECANAIRRQTRPTTSAERGYGQNQTKRWNLKWRYGLTPTQYEEILNKQNGVCAICEQPLDRPHVDHNHDTGNVRGVLCHRCNIGLHYVEDEAYRLRALSYLEQHEREAA